MPYDDPEAEDPHELVGVELPGEEAQTREMAAAFADEFAQLGFTRAQMLALFRKAEYTGAKRAWTLLGEETITRMVDESLAVWGRFTCVVTDSSDPDAEPTRADEVRPLRFFRS